MNILKPFLAIAIALLAACSPTSSDEHKIGDLVVSSPWVRATAPNAPAAGGFLVIENKGDAPDRLTSISTPAAGEVQIHEMSMNQDVMRMRELTDGLEIPAGATVKLKPGGYHLMLIKPAAPLVAGQKVRMRLSFERAGRAEVDFAVRPIDATGADGHQGHQGHQGH